MGAFRKTWFFVRAIPLLRIAIPIATFGLVIFLGLNLFCGFGICWGQKADDYVWRKISDINRQAGWGRR